jgi:hypothetical protein
MPKTAAPQNPSVSGSVLQSLFTRCFLLDTDSDTDPDPDFEEEIAGVCLRIK